MTRFRNVAIDTIPGEDASETTSESVYVGRDLNLKAYDGPAIIEGVRTRVSATEMPYRAADGVGVTLWGETMQNAVDAVGALPGGGEVLAPSRTLPYDLEVTVFTPSNTTIAGEGKGRTVFQMADGANLARCFQTDSGAANVVWRNFTLDGNQANNQSHTLLQDYMLALVGATDCLIEDVEVKNWFARWFTVGVAIAMSNVNTRCRINRCTISNLGNYDPPSGDLRNADGIFSGGVRPMVTFCTISGATDTCIVSEAAVDPVIHGNQLYNATQGIAVGAGGAGLVGQGGVISSNICSGMSTYAHVGRAILVYRFAGTVTYALSVTGNIVRDGVNGCGIQIDQCSNVTVSGNTVHRQGGNNGSGFDGIGIHVMNSYNINVTGNTVTESFYFGILIQGQQGGRIGENTVRDSQIFNPGTSSGIAIAVGPTAAWGAPSVLMSSNLLIIGNQSYGNTLYGLILYDNTQRTYVVDNDFRGNIDLIGWKNFATGVGNRYGWNLCHDTDPTHVDNIEVDTEIAVAVDKILRMKTGTSAAILRGQTNDELVLQMPPAGFSIINSAATLTRFHLGDTGPLLLDGAPISGTVDPTVDLSLNDNKAYKWAGGGKLTGRSSGEIDITTRGSGPFRVMNPAESVALFQVPQSGAVSAANGYGMPDDKTLAWAGGGKLTSRSSGEVDVTTRGSGPFRVLNAAETVALFQVPQSGAASFQNGLTVGAVLNVATNWIAVGGTQVVKAQQAAISDLAGGATLSDVITAVNAILTRLSSSRGGHGLIP